MEGGVVGMFDDDKLIIPLNRTLCRLRGMTEAGVEPEGLV